MKKKMDEKKLKEDDWLKEISRSIGEQIEEDDDQETSAKSHDSDTLNQNDINDKTKKDDDVTVQKQDKSSANTGVPIIDKDTKVEKAVIDELEKNDESSMPDKPHESDNNEETAKESPVAGNSEALEAGEHISNKPAIDIEEPDDMPKIEIDDVLFGSEESPDALENYLEGVQKSEGTKKKWSWKRKLLLVLCILGVLMGAGSIFVNAMLDKIHKENPEDIVKLETDLTDEELAAQEATLKPQEFDDTIEQQVVNILLIGEEAMSDTVGRSDSMMIATLNTVEKSIKLTSLMRDIYVTIPGYADNKLNAAYHNGGGVLLAETIEQNFGIEVDGYVRVDFSAFEDIVDRLNGVDIELTSEEAKYLNTTNYISNPANRNVVAGLQTLNGNQALGYCRVRYESASNGEANDFGRTYRQRTVLKAIFDKYKSHNVVSMISIATDLLSYVTTNLSKSEIISYVTTAASFGTLELETFRIPMDNCYYGDNINGKSVLVIDFDENNLALRRFIYAGIDDANIEIESGNMEDEKYFSYLWTD